MNSRIKIETPTNIISQYTKTITEEIIRSPISEMIGTTYHNEDGKVKRNETVITVNARTDLSDIVCNSKDIPLKASISGKIEFLKNFNETVQEGDEIAKITSDEEYFFDQISLDNKTLNDKTYSNVRKIKFIRYFLNSFFGVIEFFMILILFLRYGNKRMSIDTERLKILNEMKHLQHRLSLLNNAELLKPNNKTDTNISTKNIDFLFGLAHLHESDYENYVFIKKFIKYSLKERLINLKKELNTISVHKENLSKVLNNPELNKNDYSLSKEKHNMDFLINREKDCINKIQDIKKALSEFKILPQNEPFFKNEDDKIILNKWLIMKRAIFEFKNLGKSDEERNNEIELLKSDIEMRKREMDEVIAE